jgi:hypothetical protein
MLFELDAAGEPGAACGAAAVGLDWDRAKGVDESSFAGTPPCFAGTPACSKLRTSTLIGQGQKCTEGPCFRRTYSLTHLHPLMEPGLTQMDQDKLRTWNYSVFVS